MPLIYCPTAPDHPDRQDFRVFYRENVGNRAPREIEIGRIYRYDLGGTKPWIWNVMWFFQHGRKRPYQGTATHFDKAKTALERCWRSGSPPIDWPPSVRRPDDQKPLHPFVDADWH